ncbi:hypothetical protein GCM10023091_05900 [Ravibacter arvi]|uniref:Uncharacterized protein n=1 Tax=Ravibacter arvi TaxID=2051041 RepID=A0ABP8LPY7_9BACT
MAARKMDRDEMREKSLLIYEKKEGSLSEIPQGGDEGIEVEHLVGFLTFLDIIKQLKTSNI